MRALVVDDNGGLSGALTAGLQHSGFDVEDSGNVENGLWRASAFRYDVIIVNHDGAGILPADLCKILRGRGVTTPIMVLTTSDDERELAFTLECGSDDVLTTPVTDVMLVARVRALLRRVEPNRSRVGAEAVAADLYWDPHSGRFGVGHDEVELTPREFALLDTLVRGAGGVATRAELLEAVWGEDVDPDSNVVDVYVGYVRKKVQAAGGDPGVIETVRGAGYRIRPPV